MGALKKKGHEKRDTKRVCEDVCNRVRVSLPGATPASLAAAGLRPQLPPSSTHLQHHLAQGQRQPFSLPPGHRLLSPGARPPGAPGAAAIRMMGATEQKTLLDELLEQVSVQTHTRTHAHKHTLTHTHTHTCTCRTHCWNR